MYGGCSWVKPVFYELWPLRRHTPNPQTGQLQSISLNWPRSYHTWSRLPESVQAPSFLIEPINKDFNWDLSVLFGTAWPVSSRLPVRLLITSVGDGIWTHNIGLCSRHTSHLQPKTIRSANVLIIIGVPAGVKRKNSGLLQGSICDLALRIADVSSKA